MIIQSNVKFLDNIRKAYQTKKEARQVVAFCWLSKMPDGVDCYGLIGSKTPVLIHLN